MKKVVIYGVIIVLAALAGLYFIKKPTVPSAYVVNVDHTAVIKEIQKLQRLETASFTIEKVIEAGTKGNALKNVLFGDRILLIAHGQVIAGFDLSLLTDKDISIQDKELSLRMPPPMILVTSLDNNKTRVYDRQQGLLTKGDDRLESEARKVAEDSILSAACEANILDEASENGRKQLTAFLKALGFEKVTISIPSGDCRSSDQ